MEENTITEKLSRELRNLEVHDALKVFSAIAHGTRIQMLRYIYSNPSRFFKIENIVDYFRTLEEKAREAVDKLKGEEYGSFVYAQIISVNQAIPYHIDVLKDAGLINLEDTIINRTERGENIYSALR